MFGTDERWLVRVQVTAATQVIVVEVNVERGFIPADIDPNSGDRRSLGCWVEVH